MEKERDMNYSSSLERAEDASVEIKAIETEIESVRKHIEELEGEKKQAIIDNEFARENGFKEIDINDFDHWIKESEDIIREFEGLQSDLADIGARSVALHERGAEILEHHNPKEIIN